MVRTYECSMCGGTKWSQELGSHCPECQGLGRFPHWKNGTKKEDLESELNMSIGLNEKVKQELMDCVSDPERRATREKIADLRWERDYWSYRVQSLRNDLELMKGVDGG